MNEDDIKSVVEALKEAEGKALATGEVKRPDIQPKRSKLRLHPNASIDGFLKEFLEPLKDRRVSFSSIVPNEWKKYVDAMNSGKPIEYQGALWYVEKMDYNTATSELRVTLREYHGKNH